MRWASVANIIPGGFMKLGEWGNMLANGLALVSGRVNIR